MFSVLNSTEMAQEMEKSRGRLKKVHLKRTKRILVDKRGVTKN